jgi:predicted DNA-binding protein YlxM (UPF0122 family)
MAPRKLTDEQEREICRRYLAGESSKEIAEAFKVSTTTVINIARRRGVNVQRPNAISSKKEAEICSFYKSQDVSISETAEAFNVCKRTVVRIAKENNIQLRRGSEVRRGRAVLKKRLLSCEQEREARRLYEEQKLSLEAVGKHFGVAHKVIAASIRRSGGEIREGSECHTGLKPEDLLQLCDRYKLGEPSSTIAESYGITITSVCRILDRLGIERRDARGLGDTVQEVLDCTGRHTHIRECAFYLFELARYSETHCKPGIAFDVEARADEEYGEEVLRLLFATRAEAYFLEQAVLDATRGSADCPEDLWGWAGVTEIRAMPAEDMVPIVLRLHEELLELGCWEFAARYVPMTAAQRLQCQQRALQEVAA